MEVIASWKSIFEKIGVTNPSTSTYPPLLCPKYSSAVAYAGITVSGSYSSNQLVRLADVSLNKYIVTYGALNISGVTLSVSDIPASGGTRSSGSWSGTVYQTVTYSTGETGTITVTPTVTWSSITASSKGTTVSSRSYVGTITATFSANGASASKTASVYQAANAIAGVSISGTSFVNITSTALLYGNASYTSGSSSAASIPGNFSTSNSSIIRLNSTPTSVTYVQIYGVAIGSATITFKLNGFTATKSISCTRITNVVTTSAGSSGTGGVVCIATYAAHSTLALTVTITWRNKSTGAQTITTGQSMTISSGSRFSTELTKSGYAMEKAVITAINGYSSGGYTDGKYVYTF